MLCITETRLNSDMKGAEVSLENYNIFSGDIQNVRRGRGAALYFKSDNAVPSLLLRGRGLRT